MRNSRPLGKNMPMIQNTLGGFTYHWVCSLILSASTFQGKSRSLRFIRRKLINRRRISTHVVAKLTGTGERRAQNLTSTSTAEEGSHRPEAAARTKRISVRMRMEGITSGGSQWLGTRREKSHVRYARNRRLIWLRCSSVRIAWNFTTLSAWAWTSVAGMITSVRSVCKKPPTIGPLGPPPADLPRLEFNRKCVDLGLMGGILKIITGGFVKFNIYCC